MNRNGSLRLKVINRDNFTCQKCKIQDKSAAILEVHHITPLVMGGQDVLENLITLCKDCHHFAPNNKEEFEDYMKEETDGTLTTLMKAIEKVRKENSELFNKVQEKL